MTTISGSYNLFDRKLLLKITTLDNQVYELDQRLRIVYEIKKVLRADPDPGLIEIYNIGPELRKALSKPFNPKKTPGAKVELFVGYAQEGVVSRIYSGEIQEGVPRWEPPNWRMILRCGVDYHSFLNEVQSKAFAPGTDPIDAIKSILDPSGRKVSIAKSLINKIRKKFVKGRSFVDNIKGILSELSKEFDLSVTSTGQDGPVQISELGYPNDDAPVLLNEESGLIGSPEITHTGVNVRSLLNTRIRPGTLLDLRSRNTVEYGRNFTSQVVTHSGDTFGDANYTDVEGLFFPPRFAEAS